ncbi:sugar ABC transporter permease [Lachnospiraceae bacterium Oil+RF-744-WCA-WT-11]|uniref:Sugar ABC transporter permease n=2 Tax=Porcincola intestinalis TaxID=2606632 RepID=A0A6L5X2U7_9FIRM|nr:sugar ABC transporter permease [Porcincola intestinalis]
MLPALIWLIIFAYYPMYGLLISFKDYKGALGIMGSPWAKPIWKHFAEFFTTSIAGNVIRNTLVLSFLTILFSFPIPIVFAILLNQLNGKRKRKLIQTVSYAPYFISNVVVVSILNVICAPSGFVNTIIKGIIGRPLLLMSSAEYFRTMYIVSNIWQTMGFSAIVYIAALTGISPDYYEAAIMDGATKLQRIRHIDLPLIMPTIIIMLVLALGNVMTIGYEKVYLMQAGTNTQVSEIISTYVYKVGLQNAQYSFATAVGLFNSVVNFLILMAANVVAKKTSDISIF